MRIAINAQIPPNSGFGGVETVLIALINSLGKLDDGSEEYLIIGPHDDPEWLSPLLGPNQKLVRGPPQKANQPSTKFLPGLMRRHVGKLVSRLSKWGGISDAPWPSPSISNGFYERLGCDAIHFPYQAFTICGIKTLYSPHDLQHLHLPMFFTPAQLVAREVVYRAGCQFSQMIVVGSDWVKNDIIRQYGTTGEKLQVIPLAPPLDIGEDPSDADCGRLVQKYGLTKPFIFYPAMTWPHKNHIRLLRAVARCRDLDGLSVQLVCSGYKNEFWPAIENELIALGLKEQVHFVGFLPAQEVKALYRLAQFVIIPTLFESTSEPIFEAWRMRTPVACSNVTALPEQVQDAAYVFDPYQMDAIAAAITKMHFDTGLRTDLVKRGSERLRAFSWEKTARAYRATYKKIVGEPLSQIEADLLRSDWMKATDIPNEKNSFLRSVSLGSK